MPISQKIIDRINNSYYNEDFKELMLKILEEIDRGNYQYKDAYKKMIDDYISKVDPCEDK